MSDDAPVPGVFATTRWSVVLEKDVALPLSEPARRLTGDLNPSCFD
jgi:hypothetical protein